MILKEKYSNINRVLEGIYIQTVESIPYCIKNFIYDDPEQMFKNLKLLTVYHKDPPRTELIQTVPTLFDNNYWGIPGAGDCDCFTVLTLAVCVANGWNNNEIILKGRSTKNPAHIYSSTVFDGKKYTLDLTNTYINIERKYPLTQYLKV
jgi:hypothetical protein